MCISILIPFYNTKFEYFKECLDSIENQTFNKTYETIIINDGSNIDITNKIKEYIKTLKKEFKIYDLDNNYGIVYALNFGLLKCSFNLIARMDSDDIMKLDRLQKQYNYMLSNKECVILGGQCEIIEENTKKIKYVTNHNNIITKHLVKKEELTWFINHPTIMYKKDIILKVGPYNEDLKGHAEDTYLWIQLLKNGYELHNLNDIILTYRDLPDSLSHNFKFDVTKDIIKWINTL
tara:strand:- start:327 stop:1031 length:705 start_codon:yes stop_codon:yes gene_type:complete